MKLGELSARYESARKGVEAIGWDSGGGASYGTYQIATATGTMARFLSWLTTDYPDVKAALDGVRASMRDPRGSFSTAWLGLARGPLRARLEEAEHGFIEATHYQAALGLLPATLQARVNGAEALQQVLWSCAVQHGSGGAARVFVGAATECHLDDPGTTLAAYLRAIYAARDRRLSRLTPAEQAAVRNRYREELKDALQMATVAA